MLVWDQTQIIFEKFNSRIDPELKIWQNIVWKFYGTEAIYEYHGSKLV